MPWSGGNYTKWNGAGGWAADAAANIGIEAGRHDTQDTDFQNGINNCLAKDGSNAATADLNLGSFKITAMASGTSSSDAITLGQAQAGIDTQSTTLSVNATRFSADATGPSWQLRKSRGAIVGTNTIVNSGDTLGTINFQGANGSGYDTAAQISAIVNGTPGATTDMPGALIFSTTPDTSATPTERMRIDKDGNVCIGTTTSTRLLQVEKNQDATTSIGIYNSNAGSNGRASLVLGTNEGEATAGVVLNSGTNPALGGGSSFNIYNSMANGPLCFRTAAVERMRITAAGETITGGTTDNGAYNLQCNGTGVWGAGAYVNGSDSRLKDDIAPIDNTLDIVKSLNPVVFRYKETFSSDTNLQPGFIAQELQTALSNCSYKDGVVMQGTEYLNVAYQTLIPVLTKAIQELNSKVEILEAKVAELEA